MPIAWQAGTLESVHSWAPRLATFRIATDPAIRFEPGQFVNLALDLDGERITRSYSMASAPGDPLEFFLIEVEGGALTPALFALGVGDPLWINPLPAGHFTLAKVPDAAELWLIATGTGLGPYISMLRADPPPWARYEHVIVVHGVREAAHLAYAEELAAHAASGRLTHVQVVSREDAPDALRGRVTDALKDGRLERAAGRELSTQRSQVLLCGNPAMIEEMRGLLEERGLKRHRRRDPGHVTAEKYWG